MITITRKHIEQVATVSTALLEALVYGPELVQCELFPCANMVREEELFERVDNRDGAEVRVCEHCADHGDVSYCED